MFKKIVILSAFFAGILMLVFINLSESPAQGSGGSYDTQAGKLTGRNVNGLDVIELNGNKILEGKIRKVFRFSDADVVVASAPGNVNCPTGFNFITLVQYDQPKVSWWIEACYDPEGVISQDGQDVVLKIRESIGTYAIYRHRDGEVTKTLEVKEAKLTEDQCRKVYMVYTGKCKGLPSATEISRHLYFYKDVIDNDAFFGLCFQAGDDNWSPVSYDAFRGKVCKLAF
jgi:hypothetical protein